MSNESIVSKEEVAALLGRPLSDIENTNFDLYLGIAILRLDDLLCIKLEEMAEIPADLKLLIARCFDAIVEEQKRISNQTIKSKKVEDFSITFDETADSPMVAFVSLNSATLDKYSMCQGPIRSGKVCPPCGKVFCGHCL